MDRANVKYRQARAVELRREGLEYADIAKIVGYASKSGAWHAVQSALTKRTITAADHLIQHAYLELDRLQSKVWPAAMTGNVKAAGQCLQIMDRRIKLSERLGERLGSDLARERAADAADDFLASQGHHAVVCRDPALVFESRDVFAFVSVEGGPDGSSISVHKNGKKVSMVGGAPTQARDAAGGSRSIPRKSEGTKHWSHLQDAHGSAQDLPALFDAAERSPDGSAAWEALTDRLYCGNRVFTASYAALPLLADIALRRAPGPRNPATKLAAIILDATDRPDMAFDPRLAHADAIKAMLAVAQRDAGLTIEQDDFMWSAFTCDTFASALRSLDSATIGSSWHSNGGMS